MSQGELNTHKPGEASNFGSERLTPGRLSVGTAPLETAGGIAPPEPTGGTAPTGTAGGIAPPEPTGGNAPTGSAGDCSA